MTVGKKDGGPAFPETIGYGGNLPRPGMTLRQWYKGRALAGEMASQNLSDSDACFGSDDHEQIATNMGKIADAMIEEDKNHAK